MGLPFTVAIAGVAVRDDLAGGLGLTGREAQQGGRDEEGTTWFR